MLIAPPSSLFIVNKLHLQIFPYGLFYHSFISIYFDVVITVWTEFVKPKYRPWEPEVSNKLNKSAILNVELL